MNNLTVEQAAENFAIGIQTKPNTVSRLNAIEWFTAGAKWQSTQPTKEGTGSFPTENDLAIEIVARYHGNSRGNPISKRAFIDCYNWLKKFKPKEGTSAGVWEWDAIEQINVFKSKSLSTEPESFALDDKLISSMSVNSIIYAYKNKSNVEPESLPIQSDSEVWDEVPDEIKKYIADSLKETISIYGPVEKVATYGGATFAIFKNKVCYRINYQSYKSDVSMD